MTPARCKGSAQRRPRFSDIDPKRLLVGLLVLFTILLAASAAGSALMNAALNSLEQASSPSFAATARANLSTPASAWRKGDVPALYQADEQWAHRPYGSHTIGTHGTAATCLAMARIALTGDASLGPVETAAWAQASGLSSPSDAQAFLTDGAAALGMTAEEVAPDEMALRSKLNRGCPIVCATAAGTFDEHASYLVLASIDEHGQLVIRDPLSQKRTEQHWSFEDIIATSEGFWSYTLKD